MNTAMTSRPLSLNSYLKVALASIAGALLLTASSKFSLFIGPVPVTMQMLAVFALVMLYPARLAFGSGVAWLALGMFYPAFATPGAFTPTALTGPSGGYIMGMVLALGLSCQVRHFIPTAVIRAMPLSMANGNLGRLLELMIAYVFVYYFGLLWLGIQFPGKAISLGLLPFMVYDALKLVLALCIGISLKGVRHKLRQFVFNR